MLEDKYWEKQVSLYWNITDSFTETSLGFQRLHIESSVVFGKSEE